MLPIFLLAGGPAVGKSTTAAALSARFARGVHIPVDALSDMVVAGQALPGADWSPQLVEQLVYEHLDAVVGGLAAQGWWVLDTSEQSVEDVVTAIVRKCHWQAA